MYERYSERSFNRTNCASPWAIIGTWLCFGVAVGLCAVGSVSCGVHRELVHVVEVDKAYHADSDSCTIEVWRQYFPRRVTKFRVK